MRQSTIALQETCSLEKVQQFLNSVARNSQKSRDVYGIALSHFQKFVKSKYEPNNIESIVDTITSGHINVYTLLDNFVSHLVDNNKLTPNSVSLYVAAVRSYFAYHDLDVVPSRFKRKVRMPKRMRDNEEPIDASDIRKILLSCNNRRLKSYLLVIASSGCRSSEALSSRISDYDFSTSPTKLHIRKEYAKTRVARTVYISNEASEYLQKEWLPWKYTQRRGKTSMTKSPNDLVFSLRNARRPHTMYKKMLAEFANVLKTVGLDERKEGMLRRKLTFHSFRRYVKTVTATQTNSDFSEWFLGHQKSPYWTMKEPERREIYKRQCESYLTYLDYSALENSSKGIVSQLEQKDKEIAYLKEQDMTTRGTVSSLSDQVMKAMAEIAELKKMIKK